MNFEWFQISVLILATFFFCLIESERFEHWKIVVKHSEVFQIAAIKKKQIIRKTTELIKCDLKILILASNEPHTRQNISFENL